jgi:hypothetical protein
LPVLCTTGGDFRAVRYWLKNVVVSRSHWKLDQRLGPLLADPLPVTYCGVPNRLPDPPCGVLPKHE